MRYGNPLFDRDYRRATILVYNHHDRVQHELSEEGLVKLRHVLNYLYGLMVNVNSRASFSALLWALKGGNR